MDEKTIAILRADIAGQMALINDVFTKLIDRATDLQAGNEVQLESAAYQLHNLYGAVEDLAKIIAGHFENQITDASRWHIEILRRMKQEIPGVRPALLAPDSFALLNSLRSFRHFFRHAYTAPIEYEQLKINLEKAKQLHPVLERDVKRFMIQMVGSDGLGE
jgi:hypothetical protein